MNTIWISELDEIHSGNGGCSRTAAAYLIVRSAEMELQLIITHAQVFECIKKTWGPRVLSSALLYRTCVIISQSGALNTKQ